MRKIITTTFVTMDGVMQAPGRPDEDTSGGFAYGGWMANQGDEMTFKIIVDHIDEPSALLLGRVTYDIFSAYWPKQSGVIADPFNANKKYVVSHAAFSPEWANTECISGDVVEELKKLKSSDGPDLWVHGSGNLIQTLLKNELVDRMRIYTFPVTVGSGKRLFADGTLPRQWKAVESKVTPSGVVIAAYEPAGALKTGTIG